MPHYCNHGCMNGAVLAGQQRTKKWWNFYRGRPQQDPQVLFNTHKKQSFMCCLAVSTRICIGTRQDIWASSETTQVLQIEWMRFYRHVSIVQITQVLQIEWMRFYKRCKENEHGELVSVEEHEWHCMETEGYDVCSSGVISYPSP